MNDSKILNWVRKEEFIEGQYYPSFETKGPNWGYTIYPMVRPKKSEPTSFHFGGWGKKEDGIDKHWIEGKAKTVGECTAICEAHLSHVQSNM